MSTSVKDESSVERLPTRKQNRSAINTAKQNHLNPLTHQTGSNLPFQSYQQQKPKPESNLSNMPSKVPIKANAVIKAPVKVPVREVADMPPKKDYKFPFRPAEVKTEK